MACRESISVMSRSKPTGLIPPPFTFGYVLARAILLGPGHRADTGDRIVREPFSFYAERTVVTHFRCLVPWYRGASVSHEAREGDVVTKVGK